MLPESWERNRAPDYDSSIASPFWYALQYSSKRADRIRTSAVKCIQKGAVNKMRNAEDPARALVLVIYSITNICNLWLHLSIQYLCPFCPPPKSGGP